MTGRWVSPVKGDRTRPIVKFFLWMLTGNDRMLRSCVWSLQSSASGHNLNVLMTIEIGRSAFEANDTWQASGDRTLGSCVQSVETVKTLASVFDRTLGHLVTGR